MIINEYDNYSLLQWNTFGLDVKARKFVEYDCIAALKEVLRKYKGEPLLHIGRGSNLLFLNDFEGVVLHSTMNHVVVMRETAKDVYVSVSGGMVFDDFVAECVRRGWWGAENLSYIPGEVGASAVQNIGAYGVEAKDIISSVVTMNVKTLELRTFTNAECQYGYRDSVFKGRLKGKYIVLSVLFHLSKLPCPKLDYGNVRANLSENPSLSEIRDTIIRIRRQKLPEVNELGSAGSFFKNPIVSERKFKSIQKKYGEVPHFLTDKGVKIPAAWLISQVGMKGVYHGGAQVYEKQPLVIVNANHATSDDIAQLAAEIVEKVKTTFGIKISPEVNYI